MSPIGQPQKGGVSTGLLYLRDRADPRNGEALLLDLSVLLRLCLSFFRSRTAERAGFDQAGLSGCQPSQSVSSE